ncbi:MAG: dUTP diphosphatase [Clostridium sp.]|nr:dUTP diphosphatase [Clostridium sp.]
MDLDSEELEATRNLSLFDTRFEIAHTLPEGVETLNVRIPRRSTKHSAGYDLTTPLSVTVPARGRVLAHTGLTIFMQPDEYLQITPRSGLALKRGLTVLNTPGIVDADYYPNEIGVILYNTTDEDIVLEAGERIAQAILKKYHVVADDLPSKNTRFLGFGSTGTKEVE